MPDSRETDVVIVGAGLAGLAAARRLTADGIDCVVLEARDRVGGRTLNHSIGDGKIVEVGGQWVGPTQTRVLELMRELGLESFPTYHQGEHVIEYRGRARPLHRDDPEARRSGCSPTSARRSGSSTGWRGQVPAEAPWTAPKAKEWDSQTLWSWMRRNVYTQGAREALSLAVEAVWAAQPEDLSLLHVLFYISSAGGLDALWDTEGGAQDARVVGGSQLISIRMAEELGDRVVLEAPVRRIAYEPDRVTVHADDLEVEARRAIVAMPPTLTCRIAYDPPMPALRDQLTQRIPQGAVIKCMAIYERPFWRERGLTGQATSTDGPVKLTFDNSPPDGSPGVLLGFLEGNQARELGAWSAGGTTRGGDRLLRAPVRARGREPARLRRQELGRRGVDPRLLRLLHAAPAPGPRTGRTCGRRSGRSTGPGLRPRPCGAATWTAPCAPATALQRRLHPRLWRVAGVSQPPDSATP